MTYWMKQASARELFKDILPKHPPKCESCHRPLSSQSAFQSFVEMEVQVWNGFRVIYDEAVPANEVQIRDYQGKILQVIRFTTPKGE